MTLPVFRGPTIYSLHRPHTTDFQHVQNLRAIVESSITSTFIHIWVHHRHTACAREGQPNGRHLSRAIIAEVQLGIKYYSMATAQQQDPEVQACRTTPSSLQKCSIRNSKYYAVIRYLYWPPLTDYSCQLETSFLTWYMVCHTLQCIQQESPGLYVQEQIGIWAKQCIACQASKTYQVPLEKFIVPRHLSTTSW